jgi:hypothetical protein
MLQFCRNTYNCKPAFSVPSKTIKALNFRGQNKDVFIIVRRQLDDSLIYRGPARLTSGPEICSGNAIKKLTPGERIRVSIRR